MSLIKTSNLIKFIYAHIGIYFMYFGAVFGSNGLINLFLVASLISRDIVADDFKGKPNLSLRLLFVISSF